jgi:iron complex transport system substrate-binding protein
MISGIGRVSELIDVAGGVDIFADRATCDSAEDRIVTPEEDIRNEPDSIVGSWCGKKFRSEKVAKRSGFACAADEIIYRQSKTTLFTKSNRR